MLTVHRGEIGPQTKTDGCPMQASVGYNFVSQLRSADVEFDEHPGPLSIKCAFHGKEHYFVDGGRVAVDDGAYLILNEGQRYASEIRSARTVESFCIWFRPEFAEQVLASLVTPHDRLLDDPSATCKQPVRFFERLTRHDDLVSPILTEIRTAATEGWINAPWLEERFHILLERMLQAHRGVYRDVERLPAVRMSTRLEIFRRLHRAKDFLDSSLYAPATLDEIASVAALSPHHFLRLFKTAFHETPRQYQSRRRMEEARARVIATDQPITDICFDLGFESLGSFSWRFRRLYGASPFQLRLQHIGRDLKEAVPIDGTETVDGFACAASA